MGDNLNQEEIILSYSYNTSISRYQNEMGKIHVQFSIHYSHFMVIVMSCSEVIFVTSQSSECGINQQ